MLKKNTPIKILVVGSSVLDTIEYVDRVEYKPGGIFYTILGLTSIKRNCDTINLITNYDSMSRHLFQSVFEKVDTSFSQQVEEISSVHLRIYAEGERTEKFINKCDPLRIPSDIDYSGFEGILLNMISGNDVNVSQLRNIRSVFKGKIYCDIHSLARGFDGEGSRIHRLIPDAVSWLINIDILQVNEYELLTLFDLECEPDIIEKVFECGVSAVAVTKGERGVTLYYKNDRREIIVHELNALDVKARNVVGCGDIFGAVFFYNYILSRNYEQALKLANQASGRSTEFSSVNEYKKLSQFVISND